MLVLCNALLETMHFFAITALTRVLVLLQSRFFEDLKNPAPRENLWDFHLPRQQNASKALLFNSRPFLPRRSTRRRHGSVQCT